MEYTTGTLDNILTRARRRHTTNLLIAQGAVALSAGGAGILLLLLAGTQIFDWQWPFALFLLAFGVGVFRIRQAQIPLYRTAQALDRSLGLADRLSTAYYFRNLAGHSSTLVDAVEQQAVARVREGDVERAMPLRFPTAGYVACALAVAALSLVALRYGMLKTLSLQQPLAHIRFDTFTSPPKVEAASSKKSVVQEHLDKQLEQLGLPPEENDLRRDDPAGQPTPANVSAIANEPGVGEKAPPGPDASDPSDASAVDKGDEPGSGEQSSESKDSGGGRMTAGEKGQTPANPKNAPSKPGGGTNPGVIDKMKDAFANLLNKLGVSQPTEKGQDTASEQSQQAGAGKQQPASERGTQGQGKAQGDNQPSPDSQGKDSEGGEQTPGQQQRASQNEGPKGPNENSKSGMGKSEGDKTIQDAEQLAAMGKISEIFGKRAAEMKGEMSVEVPSGKQHLRTAYSNSSAKHAGAIADANRNEIPLAYQTYVQRYFEEVRKAAAAKAQQPGVAKP